MRVNWGLHVLERGSAFWRAIPCRAVIPRFPGAQVGPSTAAIAARYHIEQPRQVRIRIRSVDRASAIARKRVTCRDNRRSQTRAANLKPPRVSLVGHGIINRRTGIWIGVSRDVSYGAAYAPFILLPGGLRLVRATSTPCAAPNRLALSSVVRIKRQGRAADSRYVLRRRRVLYPVTALSPEEKVIGLPVILKCPS